MHEQNEGEAYPIVLEALSDEAIMALGEPLVSSEVAVELPPEVKLPAINASLNSVSERIVPNRSVSGNKPKTHRVAVQQRGARSPAPIKRLRTLKNYRNN